VTPTDDNAAHLIPTLVNGVVSESTKNKVKLSNTNEDGMLNLINELKIEINKQRNSYTENKKHKIVCIGDSHTRGFTSILTNLMGDNFDIYGVVKPGSHSSQLLETAKQEIKNLSSDDVLVICSGTNDLATNKDTLAFQNVSELVTSINHTHIILINVPHRYDTINTYTRNDAIEKLNKKLEKLTKISPHASFLKTEQNRKLYTKHGLHFNRIGKQYLLHQVATNIYSLFIHKTTSPISLGWNEIETSEGNSLNRATTRNRKAPITRSNDFFGKQP